MKPFDLLTVPLTGRHLIEASAGTGKTHTISTLFVRLIIEKGTTIDRILVVTFTQAATEELKDRIRRQLHHALDLLTASPSAVSPISELVAAQPDHERSRRRLARALIDFDCAAIFTIHGFCQRILADHTFETGGLFDTELVTDDMPHLEAVADDYWQRELHEQPPLLVRHLVKRFKNPAYFIRLYHQARAAGLAVLPPMDHPPPLNALEDFYECHGSLRDIWHSERGRILELMTTPDLNATVYGRLETTGGAISTTSPRHQKLDALAAGMDKFCAFSRPDRVTFDGFDRFCAGTLQRYTKKKGTPPEHRFFHVCDRLRHHGESLLDEMEDYAVYLQVRFFPFAREHLHRQKASGNIQFFDDLMARVHRALQDADSDRAAALLRRVREAYAAALIDEFQDTDLMQYDILTRLFDTPDHLLLMIGDPKQSIYGFRGADIFSYLAAAAAATEQFTLRRNWRSEAGLIQAVNAVFQSARPPFVLPDIPFTPSLAGGPRKEEKRPPHPGMILWTLPFGDPGTTRKRLAAKSEVSPRIADAIAGEITRLCTGQPDNRRHRPGDIAILVRTNRQARDLWEHLRSHGIPCVLYSTGSVFDTGEARELYRVLQAMAEPQRARRIRSALATRLLGFTAGRMGSDHERGVEQTVREQSRFVDYHRRWRDAGFIRTLRRLLADYRVRQKLLALDDGHRRLTDLLHLAELLHQVEHHVDGIAGMLKYLADRIQQPDARSDDERIRLETDADAVQIVTIHRSKGLEYPVVFCPFAWEGGWPARAPRFHYRDERRYPVLDLGSENMAEHGRLAQEEWLSEQLRLLYVSLTRARDRCYVIWGGAGGVDTAALTYLLMADRMPDASDFRHEGVLNALKAMFAACEATDIRDALQDLEIRAGGHIAIERIPGPSDQRMPTVASALPCHARAFTGRIDNQWQVTSFSGMVSGTAASDADDAGDWDHDAMPAADEPDIPVDDEIMAFPRGTHAGRFFHELLEEIDFTASPDPALRVSVSDKLTTYGYPHRWVDPVVHMLSRLLAVPLAADTPDLRLNAIDSSRRVSEMGFYFPIRAVTPDALSQVFASAGLPASLGHFPRQLERLTFSPAAGFLKGYIDLWFTHDRRFYLIDWKSNALGNRYSDYGEEALAAEMAIHHYVLQYHLYVLALHLYLKNRIPGYRYDTHFGGVYYLFLRGVHEESSTVTGVFRDRPRPELIRALCDVLVEPRALASEAIYD